MTMGNVMSCHVMSDPEDMSSGSDLQAVAATLYKYTSAQLQCSLHLNKYKYIYIYDLA